MNYDEAHNYLYNEISFDNTYIMLELLADDNVIEGLKLIKKLTFCDDNTAKLLWSDLKCDFGARENNPIIQQREENEKHRKENVNTYIPKCPTCGSTDLERVGMFERWLTDYGCKPDTFVCKNCGYKW